MNHTPKPPHTPGPWNYRDGVQATWAVFAVLDHSRYITRSLNPQPIAEIPRPDYDERGVIEADANARLIASAPDLLSALELALATIERLVPSHVGFDSTRKTKDVICEAIEKATTQKATE